MTPGSRRHGKANADSVRTELVEYLIVSARDLAGLSGVAAALADLAAADTVRILDLVVLSRNERGTVSVHDSDAVRGMEAIDELIGEPRGLLNDHDIEMSALPIPPGSVGIVVVVEDRWARPLSAAARLAGGRIVSGDRIPARRVEAALDSRSTVTEGEV